MQRYISVFLLLCPLIPCRAQAPPAAQIEITGTVVDAVTGQPIPRATVEEVASSADRPLTFTDTSGRFALRLKALQPVGVNVSRQGYEPGSSGGIVKESASGDGAKRDVTIRLTPLGVIHGRLVNTAGEPLPELMVEVLRCSVLEGIRDCTREASTLTDDRGEYRFWDLPPGDYYVKATGREGRYGSFPGMLPLPNSDETFGMLFHPGVLTREEAEIIRVSPGAAARVDVTMEARPAFRIRGKLLNCTSSYENAQVTLVRGMEEMGSRVRMDSVTGAFEVSDVPSGTYQLTALEYVPTAEKRSEVTVVVTGRDVSGVALTLQPVQPGVAVTGTIRYLGGSPESLPRWRGLRLIKVTRTFASHADRGAAAQIAADSSFEMSNVMPGRYRLDVSPTPGYYLHSITSGTVDVLVGFARESDGPLI